MSILDKAAFKMKVQQVTSFLLNYPCSQELLSDQLVDVWQFCFNTCSLISICIF